MGLFGKKQKKEADIPMPPPLYEMKLPETPDQLPTFPGMEEEIPQMPSSDVPPMIAPAKQIPKEYDMDDAVSRFDKEMNFLKQKVKEDNIYKKPKRPDVPADIIQKVNYPEELTVGEDVQKIEEDQYEIEQDMLESLKQTRGLDFTKPLYIMVDYYRAVIEEINETRNLLKNSEDILFRLNEIKNEEDKKYESWRIEMEDIQRKLIFVDKTLFEEAEK